MLSTTPPRRATISRTTSPGLATVPPRSSIAFVAPAAADGALVDLAAQSLSLRSIKTRLGAADVLGADDIEAAREAGAPLYVFPNVAQWLLGGCRGCVIVDWHRAPVALDGVGIILCNATMAARLQGVTRNCFPAPLVAVPASKDIQNAA